MSTVTDPQPDPSARPDETAPDARAEALQTPDELMRAATARIAALEAEAQDYKDRWMRSEAETSNVRHRAKREVDETRQYAVQKFARDVVEVAETLRRGLDSLPAPGPGEPEAVGKLREGFGSIERSFIGTLERHGIKREDPTGALFDAGPGKPGSEIPPSAAGPASGLKLDTTA
jgi:molecular chaperone GrpE